jgi:hypothetical protein
MFIELRLEVIHTFMESFSITELYSLIKLSPNHRVLPQIRTQKYGADFLFLLRNVYLA